MVSDFSRCAYYIDAAYALTNINSKSYYLIAKFSLMKDDHSIIKDILTLK